MSRGGKDPKSSKKTPSQSKDSGAKKEKEEQTSSEATTQYRLSGERLEMAQRELQENIKRDEELKAKREKLDPEEKRMLGILFGRGGSSRPPMVND